MSDKNILITGCSSGLGLALAREFCERGYRVLATARNPQAIPFQHPKLSTAALDVADSDSIRQLAAFCEHEFGGIDVLINNAGYGLMGPVIETPLSQLQTQFSTNSLAPLALAQALLEQMLARGGGHILNIGSVSGRLVTPFAGSYCASKAALEALNSAMRRELRPFNIRVQYVMAGGIRSGFGARATSELAAALPAASRYQPIEDAMRERASLSQRNGAAAESVARAIVDGMEKTPRKAVLFVGAGARRLYLLSRLPAWLQDALLSRRFGLNRLK